MHLKFFPLVLFLVFLPFNVFAKEVISFSDALRQVLSSYPSVKVFKEKREAIRALSEDAKKLPNPELELSTEDFLGSGRFRAFSSSEVTLLFSQRFPLFGKREKRREEILSQEGVISSEESLLRAELFKETALSFTDVLYAKEKVKLYRELSRVLQKLVEVSKLKFEAGKVSELEKLRAEIAAGRIEVELQSAIGEYRVALQKLYSLLKREGVEPEGDFFSLREVPERVLPDKHPKVAGVKAEILTLKKRFDLVKAEALPDLTLSGGVRYFNEDDERAYLLSVSLDIPVFNRNGYKLMALKREMAGKRFLLESVSLELERKFQEVRGKLEIVTREIKTLEEKLIPRAEEIYRRVFEGYRYGKVDLLSVLDAQRTLFELKLALLEAYRKYHALRAELFYILARPDYRFF
ncbi:TolC family protein [Phorcysia thermohydrogeniphila]|uniref:Cobalt-zinc-cadmium efflux system outer membrane protein n=1 Tax=Phorcysia thermohydrogeniphila TaxID=936138 RepID=A0A4R1GD11_9BACT|nr:TolC family protein [Phorcysia thermohydrogeniphila]TCK04670.1 cobalt-zinc-cadmium efflux system outer membrane protein [Phorcysia thermohydrogeniphila]